jgi:hypothetical protein
MIEANEQATAARPADLIRTRLAELEHKLSDMTARRTFNREERARSGPPNGTGDKNRLGDLRLEQLRLSEEQIDLEGWLTQARADLAEAERQEAIAADVILARRRLEVAELVRRGGAALDSGFSAERFEGWNQLLDELVATRLSCESAPPAPNGQQRRVFVVLAVKTMLQGVPLIAREFESVAPSQRTSFGKISADWATAAERTARAFLDGAGISEVAE